MPNHVVTDTLTLLRRNLRHTIRYPSMTIGAVLGPVIMLLLFVGVLGKTLGAGLAGTALAAAGLLVLLGLALTWLAVAMGLVSATPEAASNAPMLIAILPFVGSAFAPAAAMPAGVRQFAEYQPFTPAIETVRGLLAGTPVGHNALIALGWCAVLGAGGYAWSLAAFRKPRAH